MPLTVAAAALYLMPRKTPPLRDGEKSLTFYYMNGCPHCKRMYPDVRALGSKYRGVIIRWVEANSNDEADIDGFPTLIYRDGAGKQLMYDGPRTAAALKNFWDTTTKMWFSGALIGKPAGLFTSTATMHCGQESTLLSMMIPLLHHGMVIVGVPASEPAVMSTQTGGSFYGASHVAGGGNHMPLSADEIKICQALGKRVAEIANKLKA